MRGAEAGAERRADVSDMAHAAERQRYCTVCIVIGFLRHGYAVLFLEKNDDCVRGRCDLFKVIAGALLSQGVG